MQGRKSYANSGKLYIVSTGDLCIYGLMADGTRRLVGNVTGERLLRLSRDYLSIECHPGRKVEYEVLDLSTEPDREKPDPTPVAAAIPRQRPLGLADEMRRFIREEISREAENASAGNFEEEDDFEVEDDIDPFSPYELQELQEEELASGYTLNDEDADPPADTTQEPVAPADPKEEPAASAAPPSPSPEG